MSTRNIVQDDRVLCPGSTTVKYGRYFSLTSVGVNQSGPVLEPHNYSMTLIDRYDFLIHTSYKQCVPNSTRIDEWASGQCASSFPRSWSAADDYALYGNLERQYDKGDFNAAVFVGELGETVDMLADRTKQLAKALRAAKKGRFAQAARILGAGGNREVPPSTKRRHRDDAGPQDSQRISDGWLELQYGWMPLVNDVYTLADQIAKADTPRKRRIVARQNIFGKCTTSSPTLYGARGTARTGKQIIAYITEDIPSWPAALGLTSPELVAWELVPFSFVVDWFIPVGNYLQARSFASRAKGTFIVTTTTKVNSRLTQVLNWTCQSNPYNPNVKTLKSLGWYRYVNVNRVVYTSLPNVPLPSFSNGIMRGNRLENALALLASIFSGRK